VVSINAAVLALPPTLASSASSSCSSLPSSTPTHTRTHTSHTHRRTTSVLVHAPRPPYRCCCRCRVHPLACFVPLACCPGVCPSSYQQRYVCMPRSPSDSCLPIITLVLSHEARHADWSLTPSWSPQLSQLFRSMDKKLDLFLTQSNLPTPYIHAAFLIRRAAPIVTLTRPLSSSTKSATFTTSMSAAPATIAAEGKKGNFKFSWQQTMLRIKDPAKSLPFYEEVCRFQEKTGGKMATPQFPLLVPLTLSLVGSHTSNRCMQQVLTLPSLPPLPPSPPFLDPRLPPPARVQVRLLLPLLPLHPHPRGEGHPPALWHQGEREVPVVHEGHRTRAHLVRREGRGGRKGGRGKEGEEKEGVICECGDDVVHVYQSNGKEIKSHASWRALRRLTSSLPLTPPPSLPPTQEPRHGDPGRPQVQQRERGAPPRLRAHCRGV